MITGEGEGDVADLLDGAVIWEPVVSSWLGGECLAETVPVDGGSVSLSANREVHGGLDLVVPRHWRGRSWVPGIDDRHPLARFGQVLHVSIRVTGVVSGKSWDFRRGTYLVTDWDADAGAVRVTGESMLRKVVDARLRTPTATRAGGTLVSELKRLVTPYMGLVIDPALTDRAVPKMSWGESRIDAVKEIVAAWPARMREDPFGNLRILPPLGEVPTPLATLTDGERGTVVSAYQSDTRDGTFNVVVARGQQEDDQGRPAFQQVAQVTTGPLAVGTYGEVTTFLSTPLLNSLAACSAAARTHLANVTRPARTIPVTLAPDPRWELDDSAAVQADDALHWGFVSGAQIPLTTGDGDMRLDVEVPGA